MVVDLTIEDPFFMPFFTYELASTLQPIRPGQSGQSLQSSFILIGRWNKEGADGEIALHIMVF